MITVNFDVKGGQKFASSGNRTRAARVAGEHSTTEPTMRLFGIGKICSKILSSHFYVHSFFYVNDDFLERPKKC